MDEKATALVAALKALMYELLDAPYDPREAFKSWQECIDALDAAGDHTFSEQV